MSTFSAFRYDGKRALVVGGASGMGAATAALVQDAGRPRESRKLVGRIGEAVADVERGQAFRWFVLALVLSDGLLPVHEWNGEHEGCDDFPIPHHEVTPCFPC